jgi:membrane protein implicated in regulation of membrane protease activity
MFGECIEIILFGYPFKLWEVLAVTAVFLSALEVFMPGFILLPIGLAFGLTAVAAIFLNSWLAVLSFLGLSLFFMVWLFTKKIKKIRQTNEKATNVSGLIGQELKITKSFSNGDLGEGKLYGDSWTIYSATEATYSEGQKAKVVKIDGNKLVIE